MSKASLLRDSRWKKNYLVAGNYTPLQSLSRLRFDRRNRLDRLVLSLQHRLGIKSPAPAADQNLVNHIVEALGDDVSLFLFNTAWYKDSLYVGYAGQGSKIFFLKIYRNDHEALYQKHHYNLVQENFSGFFEVVPLINVYRNILIYAYEDLRVQTNDMVVESKIQAYQEQKILSSSVKKTVYEILPPDIYFVLDKEYRNLSGLVRDWSGSQDLSVTMIPSHGDMTPWNMGLSPTGQTWLFDFEEAGWRTAYYDYYHYKLQGLSLAGQKPDWDAVLPNVPYAREFLILYLIDQIYHAIDRYGRYQDKALKNLIQSKTQWLQTLLEQQA